MLKVWSPLARQVESEISGNRHCLAPSQRGWWSADCKVPHGADYRVFLNGESYPDPRSPWQPDGVHGASRQYDHGVYQWRCHEWFAPPLRSAAIYELHIGTFTDPPKQLPPQPKLGLVTAPRLRLSMVHPLLQRSQATEICAPMPATGHETAEENPAFFDQLRTFRYELPSVSQACSTDSVTALANTIYPNYQRSMK